MRNIKLTIAYDGTNYSGWQFQKNGKSIQEIIEKRLKKITGDKARIVGSGRTDAGVHAKAQVANFKTHSKIPLKNLQMALNTALPCDIRILDIEEMDMRFNSQHNAKTKLYRYTIMNNDFVDPFIRRFAARCFYKLDINLMREASKYLLGRHDFRSFQTKDSEEHDSIRTIKYIKIEKEADLVYIYIEADGFLYNMVRNIVGTLIEIGRKKINASYIRDILAKRDRSTCGPTMPAKGLCLMKVRY